VRSVFLICINVFLFFSCATNNYTPSEQLQIPSEFLGLVPGFIKSENVYQIIDNLGITWIRKGFHWAEIERERGAFDFSKYDDLVDDAARHGKGFLAMLGYEVPWTSAAKGRVVDAGDMPLYLNFVKEVVNRYRGRIKAYEIWNEPNWIFWKGTDAEFYELTKRTVQTIRETDQDALILGGAFWRVPKRFIEKMFDYGALDDVDIISFHPYASKPEKSLELYDRLAWILKEKGFNGEIWITEVGFPTHGWYPTRVSEKKYPDYIVKTLASLAAHGANKIFWYELFDSYNKNEKASRMDSEKFFGLLYPDLTYKEGAFAFALCGKYLDNTTYIPDFSKNAGLPPFIRALYFQGKDNNALVLWKDGPGSSEIHLSLPGIDHVRHDIASNNFILIENELNISVNSIPLFLTWKETSIGEIR
jgi:hypothetical protein